MKITVAIPSRGRALGLIDTVRLLNLSASGKHEITYIIGADADDPNTLNAARALKLGLGCVETFCTERLGSLGHMANLMAQRFPADAYCFLCDDIEPLTRNWDDSIRKAWRKRPDGVWWWRTLKERPATYCVVSHKWFMAANQRIFTDYFPFWWADVWLLHVWAMASGLPPQALEAVLDDRAYATQRMRDLKFWSDFYMSREAERKAEALAMQKALRWKVGLHDSSLGTLRGAYLEDIPNIEKRQGEKAPPTPEYIAARERAQALMGA